MQELQITMLGPSGVGKTTLLTAMYEQFEKNIGVTNLQLSPDEDSAALLQDRLIELKSLVDVFEARGNTVGLQRTEPIGGVSSLRGFQFELGKKGNKPTLSLNFRDYPGGFHESTASKEEKNFLKELLYNSHAVLVAIDAPALMEENGKYHDRVNRPQQIKSLFNLAYQNLEEPRLVILAPIKCEKYLRKKESRLALLESVQKGYLPLLEHFRAESLKERVVIVITPVQTVGSVVVSRIEPDDAGKPHFYFRKIRHDAIYCPQDSEQPLRYLLRFLIKLHLDSRRGKMFDFLRDWLGLDNHLKKAVEEFARGCKSTEGFKVIQGDYWLNM